MMRFIFRRVLLLIPMLLGTSLFIFLILRTGPSDPALDYLRLSKIPPTRRRWKAPVSFSVSISRS